MSERSNSWERPWMLSREGDLQQPGQAQQRIDASFKIEELQRNEAGHVELSDQRRHDVTTTSAQNAPKTRKKAESPTLKRFVCM